VSIHNESIVSFHKPTLTVSGVRAFAFQALLIGAAVVLPVVAHLSSARDGDDLLREGCLSLPNIQVDVPRAQSVLVRGLDANGIDHLNGVLIIDHGPAVVTIEDVRHGA
jgi:hypothetical protein